MNERTLLIDAITTIEVILTEHPTANPVAVDLLALHERLCVGLHELDNDTLDAPSAGVAA
jgi:hypothetical protein